jgi:hypothetical protein
MQVRCPVRIYIRISLSVGWSQISLNASPFARTVQISTRQFHAQDSYTPLMGGNSRLPVPVPIPIPVSVPIPIPVPVPNLSLRFYSSEIT